MKNIQGTMVHDVTSSEERTIENRLPSAMTTMIDRHKSLAKQTAVVLAPLVAGTILQPTTEPNAFLSFLSGFLLLIGIACFAVIAMLQLLHERSTFHGLRSRTIGAKTISARAVRAVISEWNRSIVRTTLTNQDVNAAAGHDFMDTMAIETPKGGTVVVHHTVRGRTSINLAKSGGDEFRFDKDAVIGRSATRAVIDRIQRIQIDLLSEILSLPEDAHPCGFAMARVMASVVRGEPYIGKCRSDNTDYVLRSWEVADAHMKVTLVENGDIGEPTQLLVQAPVIGVLSLPVRPFVREMRRRDVRELERSFGDPGRNPVMQPMFSGNARASRIAQLAATALEIDPTMTDSSGSSVRTLVEEHMPRLLRKHRESLRTARSRDVREIDAILDQGLDVVASTLAAAIDTVSDRNVDDLRTEVRFLQARHPDHADSRLRSLAP